MKELSDYKKDKDCDEIKASHTSAKSNSNRHSSDLKDSLQNASRHGSTSIPKGPDNIKIRKNDLEIMRETRKAAPEPVKAKTPKEKQKARVPVVTSEKKLKAKPKSDDVSNTSG